MLCRLLQEYSSDAPKAGEEWKGSWPLGHRKDELGEEGVTFSYVIVFNCTVILLTCPYV